MEEQRSFKVVIPARFGSSRLPGKPLIAIAGVPMIVHVLKRAWLAEPEEVVVATDDMRIAEVVHAAGGHAVMTSAEHPSGTDRLAEVAATLGWADDQIVVNLQGDEPLMPPALVRDVARTMVEHPGAHLATLAVPIADASDVFNPNAVKVTLDRTGRALYFSRAPIPWVRGAFAHNVPLEVLPSAVPLFRHLGLYAYRCATLRELTKLLPSPLELAESLEQLRALEHGMHIHVLVHRGAPPPPGVDTAEDLAAVERALADPMTCRLR